MGSSGAGRGGGAQDGGEWYARGLRFECTQCGACCTGPPGFVGFTDGEARGLARALGVGLEEFLERFTQDTPEGRSLAEVRTEHGFDCVFLDRTTVPGKGVCGVYAARPMQCRTFPWWPEHLASRRRWEALGRSCEGVGRGGFVPIERIRIERDRGG
ncbi:MAG: YkgJ family cysteine cluster protein [Phycisphaerales bacterium]